jgi:hypothetical protein
MSSNAVDGRILEPFEYLENPTVRGRGTENTLSANCTFLPRRRHNTAQESYKRVAYIVPNVQITRMLPDGIAAGGQPVAQLPGSVSTVTRKYPSDFGSRSLPFCKHFLEKVLRSDFRTPTDFGERLFANGWYQDCCACRW